MGSSETTNRPRHVLLIDAVVWAPAYPPDDPLREVRQWYARWLTGLPQVTLSSIPASADVLAACRSGVDGVILSGSPRDAWRDDPFNTKLCEVIAVCRELEIPFLGVCYGHQLLARALGGVVAPHPGGLELGNTEVELTAAAEASPLFAGLPRRFVVLSSHVDAVLELPRDAELMVRGQFTLNQGFRWNQRLFGVQFHPETDPETLRFLWRPRLESWRHRVSFDLDQVLQGLQPAPLAANILRNFVTRLIP